MQAEEAGQVLSQGGSLSIDRPLSESEKSYTYVQCHSRHFAPVQGMRVEVNGQVLSQGGNLGADRITDTTNQLQIRQNPDFLPSAIIVGLQPGNPLLVSCFQILISITR